MLNKELFFAVGSPTIEGHTKITVGSRTSNNGDITYGMVGTYHLTKTPRWYGDNKVELLNMEYLATYIASAGLRNSVLSFNNYGKSFYNTFKVKVFETGATVTLKAEEILTGYWQYKSTEILFTAADVGKVLTLEFDPPPDGYL